jgi:peptidoglycan/LPS O-acetylase OafA/YrhL
MRRFDSLDAVRGFAALAVFIAHVRGGFYLHSTWTDLTPLCLLYAGQEAVIIFFVLSGFVLSNKALHGAPQSPLAFLLGRVLRMGLPYWATLAACVLLTWWLGAPGQQALVNHWPERVDGALAWAHVWIVRDVDNIPYNQVFWTLFHEMRFALVFPLFVLALRHLPSRLFLGALAVLAVFASAWVALAGDSSEGFHSSWWFFLRYLWVFGVGGVLAAHLPQVLAWFRRQPVRRLGLWLLAALLILAYARMLSLVPQKLGWRTLSVFNAGLVDMLLAVVAAVLLGIALTDGPWQRVLRHPWSQWLGRVSFSLYLVHMLVLKTVFTLMATSPTWLTVVVAVVATLPATLLCHHGVERPAQRWAQRLAQAWPASLNRPTTSASAVA